MTEEFEVGEIAEFLGCSYTTFAECKAVTIKKPRAPNSTTIKIEFPPNSVHKCGRVSVTATCQIVSMSSVKKRVKCSTARIQEKVDLWEKDSATQQAETPCFKVGDRVRRIRSDYNSEIVIGSLGTVTTLAGPHDMEVRYDTDKTRTILTYKKNHEVLPHTNQPKRVTTMSLKITTSHKVNSQETKDMSASQQAELIEQQQKRIESLEKVKPSTKKIAASIKELKEELAAFVAHMDSLPE